MHTLFISRPIVKDGERTVQFKQCLTLRGQITNKLFCVNQLPYQEVLLKQRAIKGNNASGDTAQL